ncbi:MAG: STAS/SEC14 domain-containing protein [Bacteroidales bacterium]|nr:STAS/SEC14 domain-containing protein [Bacteroidales bacterium]
MKSTYRIYPNEVIIIETLSKNINTDEYTKLKHSEFKDPDFNRNFNLVTDLSSFDKNTDKQFLQNIIEIFKENKGKINREKSAIVVNDKNLLKKIDIKVKQNKKTKYEIKVFTNIEDARKWVSK